MINPNRQSSAGRSNQHFRSIRRFGQTLTATAIGISAMAMLSVPVKAHPQLNVFENPPLADLQRGGIVTFKTLSGETNTLALGPNEVHWETKVKFTTSKIRNPNNGVEDTVKLRTYTGKVADPKIPYVGPTVDIRPGETWRVTIHNDLPQQPLADCVANVDVNTPHCFNTTNLHTHGLWISPTGNSDNVLLSIRPGVTFQYESNIPIDHPAGTFWYHPHLHGSTAIQVSNGMAGALIIRGDRAPTPTAQSDLDTLLRDVKGNPHQERIVLLQQLPYACRDAQGKITTDPATGYWICKEGAVGEVTNYGDQLSPGDRAKSGRHTSVNGKIAPRFE